MRKSGSKSKISNETGSLKAPGVLIVLSAPSGCGKTTLVDRLLKRHPDWIRSISATTRPLRPGEKKGEDYFFLTPEEFQKMGSGGEFLETATVFGQEYGTPQRFVEENLWKGKNVILAIDVQGTRKVKKNLGQKVPLLAIFVLPPSVKVLRERLEGRKTDSVEEIGRRIDVAQEEIKEAKFYDVTVVNQNLEQTVLEIEAAIEKFENERGA